MRDSVDSVELNNLLSSLHIGKDSNQNNLVKLEATSSESDEDYCVEIATSDKTEDALDFSTTPINIKPTGRSLPSYEQQKKTEIIDLIDDGTDADDDEDNVIIMPTTARKTINLIDSSSEDEEEDEDETDGFQLVASRSSRKEINLIDSSSGSEDEDTSTQRPAILPTSASLLLPSLSAILQRPGGSKDELSSFPIKNITTKSDQAKYDFDFSNSPEEPSLPPSLPPALDHTVGGGARMSHAAFAKRRTHIAREIYAKYNALVFNNVLPSDMDISWNKRLATTAGLTHYKREVLADPLMPSRYTARIELSCKVLDTPEKLERTMVHEMCHCAAWLVDHVAKPPHGAVFKTWADRAMRAAPHLDVSTCHAYEIFYAFQYQCTGCNQTYGRHSNSIDCSKKVCGVCRGRLQFLGKFERGGSPAKTRKPSAFNLFIKENFSAAMKEKGPGAVSSEVMKELTGKWKAQRTSGGENIDNNSAVGDVFKMSQTGILYAIVARGNVILAEYSSSTLGNAGVVSLQILEKINASHGERLSYLVGDHIVHLLLADGLTFLCMTPQTFNRRVPFAFLEDIRTRFTAAHGSSSATASAYAFNQTFAPILRERAAYHNNPMNDTVSRVTGEVNGLREVMVENIERVLERGDRLELLVQKTDDLSDSAFVFKRGAATLKREMWWRNIRTTSCVVLLVLFGLYILAALLCSPTLQHC